MSEFPGENGFDIVVNGFTEEDKVEIALGVTGDILEGLENKTILAGGREECESGKVVDELMGECEVIGGIVRYCRFYGTDPDFCDRSCGESWDTV